MARSNYEYPGYDRTGTTYWSKTVALYLIITFGAVWMVLPLWWTVTTAFSANPSTGAIALLPNGFTVENFVNLWNRLPLMRWFLNTIIFAGAVTAFNLIFDSLAGYALAKIDFWGREKLFLGFISTMMIPGMVTLIPVYILLYKLGWINTYQGLIAPLAANPFGIFLLRQHFKSLPSALGDAARIDGCNEFQTFYKIYLPIAKPALATLGIFTFMGAWNNFEWPLIIASDLEMYTLPVALFAVRNQYYADWGMMMAAATIIVVPVIAAFLAAQKYFIRGMSLSGMKG
ncbi:carbohydrate ABC transporter membrane protein 2, CUT1 family [Haladaptatus litoreus]|uniref:Carbohydrate ABC transporter membrane protein 2, CUT1 family n=1 Tax=Haladaptatus litoreus TaxID=553468 RepID=A0A1N7CRH5_9EURY|nr:carbohydrate ABC transporter permease [Haladaptatus litoreus]SIR66074.1 carbohydrate ABC transporter membrane protein 2, CUT1 family [Haladaptatus litoreus]